MLAILRHLTIRSPEILMTRLWYDFVGQYISPKLEACWIGNNSPTFVLFTGIWFLFSFQISKSKLASITISKICEYCASGSSLIGVSSILKPSQSIWWIFMIVCKKRTRIMVIWITNEIFFNMQGTSSDCFLYVRKKPIFWSLFPQISSFAKCEQPLLALCLY